MKGGKYDARVGFAVHEGNIVGRKIGDDVRHAPRASNREHNVFMLMIHK